jgi:hypothetical protein
MLFFFITGCFNFHTGNGGVFIGLKVVPKYFPYFIWKIKRITSNIYAKLKEKLLICYQWFVPAPPQAAQPDIVNAQP